MPDVTPPILPAIIAQHIEGAADLRATRSFLLRAPHVNLFLVARHDDRIRAHLDGLSVAGDAGYHMAQEAQVEQGVGQMFMLMVAAIERRDREQIDRLLALLGTVRYAERALASAFGWVSASRLRGLLVPMLTSADPLQRALGIAACALHRVDPGLELAKAIEHPDGHVRARALRAAGELGRLDQLESCRVHLPDPEPVCRFKSAWSAALLGGGAPVDVALESFALQPGPYETEALRLLLLGADAQRARALVRKVASAGGEPRKVIQATGWAGDAQAVPWLIEQMTDDRVARVAGEAFTMLTGADLARLQLERIPPEKFEGGPTEDAEDNDVAIDADEGLPWPDPEKIAVWWKANGPRFQSGVRYFMGQPPSREHCINVLKTGYQRQRIAAAQCLCLLQPGTPLFNTAAPAWRQQRWLSKLT